MPTTASAPPQVQCRKGVYTTVYNEWGFPLVGGHRDFVFGGYPMSFQYRIFRSLPPYFWQDGATVFKSWGYNVGYASHIIVQINPSVDTWVQVWNR